jgi:hypothetical protein
VLPQRARDAVGRANRPMRSTRKTRLALIEQQPRRVRELVELSGMTACAVYGALNEFRSARYRACASTRSWSQPRFADDVFRAARRSRRGMMSRATRVDVPRDRCDRIPDSTRTGILTILARLVSVSPVYASRMPRRWCLLPRWEIQ